MSVLTETALEGIDLEGTPPCQVTCHLSLCGRPAAYRIHGACERGHTGTAFICEGCHALFLARQVTCENWGCVFLITGYL